MAKSDPVIDAALYDWWERFKREHGRVPTPAQSFEAGYRAARKVYMAHAEKAIKALSKAQPSDDDLDV